MLREAAGLLHLTSGRRPQSPREGDEPLREESSLGWSRGSLSGSLGPDWEGVEEADQLTRTAAVVCREVSVRAYPNPNPDPDPNPNPNQVSMSLPEPQP